MDSSVSKHENKKTRKLYFKHVYLLPIYLHSRIPKKTKSRDDLDENMPITESENGLVEDTSPKFSSCEKIKPQYEALNTKLTWFRWNSGMEV